MKINLCISIDVPCPCGSEDYSTSRLFITAPTPRTEIGESAGINISCEAVDANSVAFEYQNESGSWVSIGSGTNTVDDTWTYSSWSPTVSALAVKAIATYPDASTQECVNNLWSYGINDTFTDTNGTAIGSHTPDDNLGAAGWVASGGDWEIQSNALEINTADTNTYELLYDNGNKNAIFKFRLSTFTTTATMQFVFRWFSADDRFLMLLVFTSGVYRILDKYENGTPSATLYDSTTSQISAGDDIELWVIDDFVNVIINGAVNQRVDIGQNISHTDTKFGFRRAGSNDTPRIDNAQVIPIHSPVIDSSVSYTSTKNGTIIFTKNQDPPNDTNGIMDADIVTVGSTNYMVYGVRNSSNVFAGVMYATSPTSDPHNWTVNSGLIISNGGGETIADASAYYDGGTWYVLYSNRTTGTLEYASGSALTSLTKQGTIKDLTGSGLYVRQSSVIVVDGTWYVYCDIRTDQVAGEFGYIRLFKGSSLATLDDGIEVLSTPGYEDDALNISTLDVRYNSSNGYYEMLYSGYVGLVGSSTYTFLSNLAISKYPDGKFKRVQSNALIDFGAGGSIDELGNANPMWMPGTDIVYYQASGLQYTYTTLS